MTKKALPVVSEEAAIAAFSMPKGQQFYTLTARRMYRENPVLFDQWYKTSGQLPREVRTSANRASLMVYHALRAQALEEKRCLPVVVRAVILATLHGSLELRELYQPKVAARMCADNTALFDCLCAHVGRLPDGKSDVAAEAAYLVYAYLNAQASVDQLESIHNS